jgi:peptidoglycan hydrolase CwlO-like protein
MKKWLLWVAIILLVINLTAIITVLYNRKKQNVLEGMPLQELPQESASSVKYSGRWFRDELGMTREQMREFSQFNPAFRQKVRRINIELAEKKQLMLNEMNAENSDTSRLNALSDSIGMLHAELKKATYAYYLEFKKISTLEQVEKLRMIFTLIFEVKMPAGPGRGMQGGGGRFGMHRRDSMNH